MHVWRSCGKVANQMRLETKQTERLSMSECKVGQWKRTRAALTTYSHEPRPRTRTHSVSPTFSTYSTRRKVTARCDDWVIVVAATCCSTDHLLGPRYRQQMFSVYKLNVKTVRFFEFCECDFVVFLFFVFVRLLRYEGRREQQSSRFLSFVARLSTTDLRVLSSCCLHSKAKQQSTRFCCNLLRIEQTHFFSVFPRTGNTEHLSRIKKKLGRYLSLD